MVTHYFTLRALVAEWRESLVGSRLVEAFSQTKEECTIALGGSGDDGMIRASTARGFPYLYRSDGYNRARRNVASLFPTAVGATVAGFRLAHRDRLVYMDLADGRTLRFLPFGPRANVLLVDAGGMVEAAFQHEATLAGTPAPVPVPAPEVPSLDVFRALWPATEPDPVRALSRLFVLFDRELAAEALYRAGMPDTDSPDGQVRLFAAATDLERALHIPAPVVYERAGIPVAFSLIPLAAYRDATAETFDSVGRAVEVFVRRRLAHLQFKAVFDPLERQLAAALDHARRGADQMLESLAQESRAERYERWAHLLMAQPDPLRAGAEFCTVPDLFADQQPTTIPLSPETSVLENARAYYEKARHTREARQHAESRLLDLEGEAAEAHRLLAALRASTTAYDVRQFVRGEADALSRFGSAGAASERPPFRRFDLGQGFEVWVGKNAQQNDALTFHHARKFDLWMHARGLAGSHAVLRRPGRTAVPPKPILEQAAGIAAYYSKGRGSDLVPVIVAERKHVRKPRGAAAGAVVVERERVLLVPPALPG
jgi:predicted ribosome quality control (RQC) complex YloA/Tae2 family protein